MTAAWPSDVPYRAQRSSFSEAPEVYKAEFKPTPGQQILRERTRMLIDLLEFDIWVNGSQYESFLTFYRTTLANGILPFTMIHPRTETVATFVFTDPPAMNDLGYNLFKISLKMRLGP